MNQVQTMERGPHSRRLTLALVFAAALRAFVTLAFRARGSGPGSLDAQVWSFVGSYRSDALNAFFEGYTGFGRWFVLALAALAAMTASLLLNVLLKLAFARGRPPLDAAPVRAGGYSMPSGHAASSATFALALIVIAWPTRWRVPATILAAAFALLMGASRIYLGVHWLTDVLAGWAMATAVVSGTLLVMDLVDDA